MAAHLNEKLTADRVRFLFSYDQNTGDLSWRNPTSPRIARGDKAGVVGLNGRRYVGIDGVRYLAHRIIWLYAYGTLPEDNISPENGNYDDLRLANLKLLTTAETSRKNFARATNTTGVRGVVWVKAKNKWRAEITRDYQKVFLGYFATKEAAGEAYLAATRNYAVKPKDPDARRKHAAHKLAMSRLRRLWKKLSLTYAGTLGWQSFSAFCDDLLNDTRPHEILVPIDQNKPIGPGNYKWVDATQFDTSTRDGRLAYQRHYRSSYPEVAKDSDLRKSFGITLQQYNDMLEKQGHVCRICRKPEVEFRRGKLLALAVDHCHDTTKVRGLLCVACNSGLARFKDDPAALRAAADYVEHFRSVHSVPASSPVPLEKER